MTVPTQPPPADDGATAPRPLFEVTPETAERLRDPRLVLAVVAIAAGAIALLLGWYGVSGTFDPGEQMSYVVSGGLGGLFLAGVGAALVSSSNVRQATRKIDDLQRGMDELLATVDELRSAVADATARAEAAARPAPARRTRKAAARS
jgi:outer membrane murein-binding lipoprotein Lpp